MVSAGSSDSLKSLIGNALCEFPQFGGVGGVLGATGRFPVGGSSSGGVSRGVTGLSCPLEAVGNWGGGSTSVTGWGISREGAGWEGESVVVMIFLGSGAGV